MKTYLRRIEIPAWSRDVVGLVVAVANGHEGVSSVVEDLVAYFLTSYVQRNL